MEFVDRLITIVRVLIIPVRDSRGKLLYGYRVDHTCLCVTINPDFSYLLQSYAARSGLRAIQVKGYAKLLQAAREAHPAVIFLEVDLVSNQSLSRALRALKEDAVTQEMPLVLISWVNEQETAALDGVDVYLRKPVMFMDFAEALIEVGVCIDPQDA
jgi:CheY-like chemotaxis protein